MKNINRLITMAALLCLSLAASAQKYQLGQIITLDGHNCVVVRVDSTGEHGLAAGPSLFFYGKHKYTPHKFSDKKFRGKNTDDALRMLELGRLYGMPLPEVKEREEDAYVLPILGSLANDFGEQNQQTIVRYCQEKGIDMAKYFPEFAWAQSLGEGWFLGGWNDIWHYCNSISISKKKAQALNQISKQNGFPYFYPIGLYSSTRRGDKGKMYICANMWSYRFRVAKEARYEWNVQLKRQVQKWVEVQKLKEEFYKLWLTERKYDGGGMYQSKQLSTYYGPDYTWPNYDYWMAFKKF